MRGRLTTLASVCLLCLSAAIGASAGGAAGRAAANRAQAGGVEPASEPGKYGGTLTTSSISSPKTFNPILATETSSTDILDQLFLSLNTLNYATLEWTPSIAELPEISADGLTYTYRLREGLKWSDGQPLTADDVVFTAGVVFDPETETSLREGMLISVPQPNGTFKREPFRVTRIDDRTVQFKLPVKFAPADTVFAFPIIPKHKLEGAYRAGRFNASWPVGTPVSQLVSSGAWVISEYLPDQRVVLTRNPHSWLRSDDGKPLPFLDRWTIAILSDFNQAGQRFYAGRLDVQAVPIYQYEEIKRGEATGNYRVVNAGPGWGFNYLGFNLNPNAGIDKNLVKLFQDVRFRRAISHAVNRKRIADEVFAGLARPLYGPVSPANRQFYDPAIPKFTYDLKKARALLDQMGLKDSNGNGIREFRGKDVKFTILTNDSNALRVAMASMVAEDLQHIGLNALPMGIDFNALVTRLDAPPYRWQATVLGFTGGPEPYAGSNIWLSSAPQHQWWPRQAKPSTPWEAEIDRIWGQAAQELDPVKRKALYDRWQRITAQQQPFIFTVVTDVVFAVRNRLGNVKPTSLGAVWNSEEIFDRTATRDRP
ncbi:MAG: ABC transporter substrate-binding protein [Armatimonadota bacterium]